MTAHPTRRLAPLVAVAALAVTGAAAAPAQGASRAAGTGTRADGAAATATATPSADSLRLVRTRTSLLGRHLWYQQTYRGLPVLGGYLVRHLDRSGRMASVDDGRRAVTGSLPTSATVTASTAAATAARAATGERTATDHSATGGTATDHTATAASSPTLSVLPGASVRLVWRVVSPGARGSVETVVDATTGKVLRTRSLVRTVNGRGRVFNPNPVVSLHDESLRDRHDADYAALRPAYQEVRLTHLAPGGYLRGDYAHVIALGQRAAYSPAERFDYDRSDNRFEQVMSYAAVTRAQEYIHSLGFTDVNDESQVLLPDHYQGDNSFYDPANDTITLGTGGVDDAEDAEVIWHEYGHAIQDDQVPGFGSSERAGAIGEGFGDYWAVTMSQPVSSPTNLPCVADWDSVSYTSGPVHCLRRTDLDLTVRDVDGEVHHDGQIWSRALWDVHRRLGRVATDRIVLESQFRYMPDTTFAAAARVTVATARVLYGVHAAEVTRRAFADRGIL